MQRLYLILSSLVPFWKWRWDISCTGENVCFFFKILFVCVYRMNVWEESNYDMYEGYVYTYIISLCLYLSLFLFLCLFLSPPTPSLSFCVCVCSFSYITVHMYRLQNYLEYEVSSFTFCLFIRFCFLLHVPGYLGPELNTSVFYFSTETQELQWTTESVSTGFWEFSSYLHTSMTNALHTEGTKLME